MAWGHEHVIILSPFVFFDALPAEDTFRRQPFTVGLYLFHPLLYFFSIVSPPILAYYSFAAPLSPFLICECDTSSASKPVFCPFNYLVHRIRLKLAPLLLSCLLLPYSKLYPAFIRGIIIQQKGSWGYGMGLIIIHRIMVGKGWMDWWAHFLMRFSPFQLLYEHFHSHIYTYLLMKS